MVTEISSSFNPSSSDGACKVRKKVRRHWVLQQFPFQIENSILSSMDSDSERTFGAERAMKGMCLCFFSAVCRANNVRHLVDVWTHRKTAFYCSNWKQIFKYRNVFSKLLCLIRKKLNGSRRCEKTLAILIKRYRLCQYDVNAKPADTIMLHAHALNQDNR